MRIKLALQPGKAQQVLPFNYQYYLSAAIYNILSTVAPDYSQFLHGRGYSASTGRLMKLFTFSKLQIPRSFHTEGGVTTRDPRLWFLYLSSPMQEDFVQNFVMGLFDKKNISLHINGISINLQIVQVESLAAPEFTSRIYCKTLSPIVVSTVQEKFRRKFIHYYRPDEDGLSRAILQNLRSKWGIVQPMLQQHPKSHSPDERSLLVEFHPDGDYIRYRQQSGKRVTKKITIKPGTPEATEIIGFELPFWLEGSPELMQVAWECGIGEHNSQGFGMIEVVERSL